MLITLRVVFIDIRSLSCLFEIQGNSNRKQWRHYTEHTQACDHVKFTGARVKLMWKVKDKISYVLLCVFLVVLL